MHFGRIWREMMEESHAWAAENATSPAVEVLFLVAETAAGAKMVSEQFPRGKDV